VTLNIEALLPVAIGDRRTCMATCNEANRVTAASRKEYPEPA